MAKNIALTKRALIDKANSTVVAVVGVAAFVLIFSLVATKTLASQAAYQNRIISAKRTAVKQLKSDIAATSQLKTSYGAFTSTTQNALGGNPSGTGAQDGNNAKVVLDALPSSYDFPALTTSLESLLGSQGVKIGSISGTDDEVAQSSNQTSVSPQPVPIPFQVSVSGNYGNIQNVVSAFDRSIRPMQLQTIDISGGQEALNLTVTAQTYYQPAKSLNINKKVVK
jgi:hypothetical protein